MALFHSGTGLTAHLLPLLSDKGITVSAAVLLGARVQVRRQLYWFSFLPSLAIELMRLRDRAGGLYSHSVNRFLHHAASDTLRRQQLAFNMRSRTSTLVGILRNVHSFPGTQDWYRIACPLLLLVGDDEKVNPPADSYTIQQLAPDAREVVVVPQAGHNLMTEQPGLVGAIIARFLVEDVGLRVMDPAYQMTVMSEPGNKWSLKNYDKWKRTPAVTEETVRGTLFRGMKVMREGDDEHSPMLLRQRHPEIGLVCYVGELSYDFIKVDPLPGH